MSPVSEHMALMRREAWLLTDALIEWRMLLIARIDFTEIGLMQLEDTHQRVVDQMWKEALFQ